MKGSGLHEGGRPASSMALTAVRPCLTRSASRPGSVSGELLLDRLDAHVTEAKQYNVHANRMQQYTAINSMGRRQFALALTRPVSRSGSVSGGGLLDRLAAHVTEAKQYEIHANRMRQYTAINNMGSSRPYLYIKPSLRASRRPSTRSRGRSREVVLVGSRQYLR